MANAFATDRAATAPGVVASDHDEVAVWGNRFPAATEMDAATTGDTLVLASDKTLGLSAPASGTIPAPTSYFDRLIPNAAGTGWIVSTSRGVAVDSFGADPTGSADSGAAIRSAAAQVAADGGGELIFSGAGAKYRMASTANNDTAEPCGVVIDSRVHMVGAGRGHGRSGSAMSFGPTVIYADTAMDFLVYAEDVGSTSPDHRGGSIRRLHLDDNSNYVAVGGIGLRELNTFVVEHVSIAHMQAANVAAIYHEKAENGSVTEWIRYLNLELWDNQNGIWIEDNGPDTLIHSCTIQTASNVTTPTGAYGIYISGSAVRVIDTNVLFYDKSIYIDGLKYGRGEHIKLTRCHLEGYQSANAGIYSHFIHITGNGGEFLSISDCEFGNPSKYAKWVEIGANVEGTTIRQLLKRNTKWFTNFTADAEMIDGGTNTDIAR